MTRTASTFEISQTFRHQLLVQFIQPATGLVGANLTLVDAQAEDELLAMERIVQQYLDFAEGQAVRRIRMNMADWITKLHGFLTLNDRDILQGVGKVSRKDADTKALAEFEKYRVEQDRTYISDFDRSTKKLLGDKSKSKGKAK